MFFLLTLLASSIIPDQDNAQYENALHGPRIIPDIIQNKLNKFISKFTIKLFPKKYADLIKSQQKTSDSGPNIENKKVSLYSANKNTDFVFYATFSILFLSIITIFYIFIRQIANINKKNNQVNEVQK